MDVLVTALAFGGRLSGFELIRSARSRRPSCKVIVVSTYVAQSYVGRALREGVHGYLSEHEPPERIATAVHRVHGGESFVSSTLGQDVHRDGHSVPDPTQALTEREMEILHLLGHGQTTKEIAATLGVSSSTVATHQGHMKAKLDIRSIPALRHYAMASLLQ